MKLGKLDDTCVIYFRHADGLTTDDVVNRSVVHLSTSTSSTIVARELQGAMTKDGRAVRYFQFDGYRDSRRELAAYSQGVREVVFFVLTCQHQAWRDDIADAFKFIVEGSTYEVNLGNSFTSGVR
jgi:hypothetical protein